MIYVTDSLRLSPEGKMISQRWVDLVTPAREVDAERIISDVVSRAGLEVTRHEPSGPSGQDHL